MFQRFQVTLASLTLALALSANSAQGAVSYLLIQGNFDGVPGMETSRWQVTYNPATLITGYDLLKFVLGSPSPIALHTEATSTSVWTADATTWKATYDTTYGSHFISSFTRNGIDLTSNFSISQGWNYYVAGGGGSYGSNYIGAPYLPSSWTFSNDGSETRTLSDGSFDAWTFGSTGIYDPDTFEELVPPDTVVGYSPLAANFSGATVNLAPAAAPEPGRSMLLLFAGMALISRRRRTLSSSC